MEARCVGALGSWRGHGRLGEDMLSIRCRVVLKSPPIMCGKCGSQRSQVVSSLKNCFVGLLGA